MQITGKTALVTGGGVRIGAAVSRKLAERGAKTAIHYHSSEKEARQLLKELWKTSLEAALFHADLTSPENLSDLVESVEKKWGPIDILINNAAIFEKIPFFEVTPADWNKHMALNLEVPFFLSQKIGRGMMERKKGKIIHITDIAAKIPYKDYTHYAATKAALISLTRGMAREMAPHVQVNAVALGPTLPPRQLSPTQREAVSQKTLLKKWGNPEEVANAVLFLLEGTDFATGSVITLDGGRHLV